MADATPLAWPIAELVRRYADRTLSPVEVAEEALRRIEALDGGLHAFLSVAPELTLEQARDAEARYRRGGPVPALLGVPVSVKDLFDLSGTVATLGSVVFQDRKSQRDSLVVRHVRDAGAVFVGKTNTAEFGQSATTDNRLGPGCGNPWDLTRTAGGSSGGAAASVAGGFATIALGSDGGGSIRIPAAFCGLFGLKPTIGLVEDDSAFRGMTDFVAAGPLARCVADARPFLQALTGRSFVASPPRRLRIAWCPRPQGYPVDPGVLGAVSRAVETLASLGHDIVEAAPPVDGWKDIFGPLVLADERRYRRELLESDGDRLTTYARRAIEASADVSDAEVAAAREELKAIRERFRVFFEAFDLIVTPTTATVAFPLGRRPREIAGEPADRLWGPFPFTAPFNVTGGPAATVPCGLSEGLPVGVQLVGAAHRERLLLDVCEELETALAFSSVAPMLTEAGGRVPIDVPT
jgi:Asp-tRNA(Asn)/Glu-tRNA(Gln) amidotransferase A subunit family amidase